MEQETKKISFVFSKLTKKPPVFQKPANPKQNKIQLIDCLEGQAIKIKGAVKEVKGPLVIPMVESSGSLLGRRRELKLKREVKTENDLEQKPELELTEDEIAAKELIKEAQNTHVKPEGRVFTLPAVTENIVIEGKSEPTLDDYESVPISDYGMAMLRGMGWKEGTGIGKNSRSVKVVEPTLRPKGMGLGVNKSANPESAQKAVDKNGKELILKKGAYAKLVEGKQKGNYCEVQGFDEESGRVIVKTTLQGLVLSVNEFMIKPVAKEEYAKSSKVINNAKYEEYKSSEVSKQEPKSSTSSKKRTSSSEDNSESERSRTNQKATSRSRQRKYSSDDSDEHKSRRKTENERESDMYRKSRNRHRSSSRSSRDSSGSRKKYRERKQSSSSDYESKDRKKSKKRSKDKSKRRDSSSDSNYGHRKTHKSTKHKRRHDKKK